MPQHMKLLSGEFFIPPQPFLQCHYFSICIQGGFLLYSTFNYLLSSVAKVVVTSSSREDIGGEEHAYTLVKLCSDDLHYAPIVFKSQI